MTSGRVIRLPVHEQIPGAYDVGVLEIRHWRHSTLHHNLALLDERMKYVAMEDFDFVRNIINEAHYRDFQSRGHPIAEIEQKFEEILLISRSTCGKYEASKPNGFKTWQTSNDQKS